MMISCGRAVKGRGKLGVCVRKTKALTDKDGDSDTDCKDGDCDADW